MTSLPPPEPFTHRQIVIILSGLMAGLFLAALDQTIVATALPTIVGELGGLDYYSWVVTAYLLCSTVCTPLYGKLSDIYGRRVTFQAAILIFLLGSVLAGLAPGMLALVLSRGVQGVGAGGVMGLTFAVIGDIVSPRQRGRYIGYLAGVWMFASVIGPLLGGFIVDHATWRWVFLINLPVGGAALAVIWVVLRLPPVHRPARIDFAGAALLMAGVSMLLLAIVRVQEGGAEALGAAAAGLTAAGMALIAAFIRWEAHVEHPLLPLRLFGNRIFSIGSGLGLLIGCALFGGVIFLPLFLQVVAGLSATNSGLLLLPLTAGVLVGSVGSGRLTSRTGRYRIYPIAGSACAVGGMFLLSRMHAGTPHLVVSAFMALLGLGIGMVMQVSLLAVQNAVEHRDRVHVRKVRGFVPGCRTRLDRPTVCQWMDCQHEDPIMPDEQIAALERQHAHLRSQFASIGEMRSGSLTERFRPCGKPRCHCAKPSDPGHGPVLSLTRKQAGKTVTRIIPAHAGSETQARLAEYRRFRQLSKMFIEVNDALSEARLATGSAAKKNRRPR